MNTTTTATRPASAKQIAFIRNLFDSKDLEGTAYAVAHTDPTLTDSILAKLDSRAASRAIDALLALPRATAPVHPDVVAPDGMHRFGGVIFKVQTSPETGRAYAKALLEDGQGGWAFEYVRGAVRNLSARTLLSLEEAKEFGAVYGTCCVCARTLTNEDSIAAGIGPVCASKF